MLIRVVNQRVIKTIKCDIPSHMSGLVSVTRVKKHFREGIVVGLVGVAMFGHRVLSANLDRGF